MNMTNLGKIYILEGQIFAKTIPTSLYGIKER